MPICVLGYTPTSQNAQTAKNTYPIKIGKVPTIYGPIVVKLLSRVLIIVYALDV